MQDELNKSTLLSMHKMVLDEDANDEAIYYPIQRQISADAPRYGEVEEAFEGGVKYVYRVYDRINSRHVAIAQLKKQDDQEAVERFFGEARLTSSLQHPNIMPIYDIGYTNDGKAFFSMKLMSGENLAHILREIQCDNDSYLTEYSLPVLLGIFTKICDAIAYAHSKNIIHLDLKPGNIQIGHFGEVIVSDWGLGKVINDSNPDFSTTDEIQGITFNDFTLTGKVKGTPGYMAPEQIDTTICDKGKYTDIYALGAILYEILTGDLPVEGEQIKHTLENTRKGQIIPPEKRRRRFISQSLEAVALKALSLNPEERYHNAEELKSEIDAYLQGFATEAEGAGFLKQLALLIKRNRRIAFVILTALLVIFSGTLMFISEIKQSEQEALQLAGRLKAEKDERERAYNLYEKQRLTSKKNLQLYQGEVSDRQSVVDFYTRQILNSYKGNAHLDVLHKSDILLELDPDNQKILSIKAKSSMILKQFNRALQVLKKIKDPSVTGLKPVAQKYIGQSFKNVKSQDGWKVPLLEYYRDLKKYNYIDIIKKQYEVRYLNPITKEPEPLLAFMMKIYNPELKRVNLKIKQIGKLGKLDLSNNPGLTNLSALKKHKIHILNLSNTSVTTMKEFTKGQFIVELDISHTPFANLNEIRSFPKLKKLTIHKGQFSEKELKRLPRFIEISIH